MLSPKHAAMAGQDAQQTPCLKTKKQKYAADTREPSAANKRCLTERTEAEADKRRAQTQKLQQRRKQMAPEAKLAKSST
jgi:hypothetical protein